MAISTSRVWAKPLVVDGNVVRQLLVEQGQLELETKAGDLRVVGKYGSWPALRSIGHD